MSTILEALRKLQAEREQPASAPKELRSSLVERGSAQRKPAASGGPNPVWIGAAVGGAVVIVAAAVVNFWPLGSSAPDPLDRAVQADPPTQTPGRPALPAPSREVEQELAMARPNETPDPETQLRLDQINAAAPDRLRREVARVTGNTPVANRAQPAPSAPSANGRGIPTNYQDLVAQMRDEKLPSINFQGTRFEASDIEGLGSPQAQPRAAAPAQVRPPAPTPPPSQAFAQRDTRSQARFEQPEVPPYVPPTARGVDPSRLPSASEERSERAPRSLLSGAGLSGSDSRRSSARPAPSRDPVERDPVRPDPVEDADEAAEPFPRLQVESVQWHPDPSLRRAVVLVDGVLSEEVREGDLFEGLFIDRIEPGSVEFRLGAKRKAVQLGS